MLNGFQTDKQGKNAFRYFVLYKQGTEQSRLVNIINQYIPEGRGEAFYPCMEYYRRGDKTVDVKPMFPGYVFLYSDLDMRQVHEMIREHRAELNAGVRELGLAEQRAVDPEFELEIDLPDLSDPEEEFMDNLRAGRGLLEMSGGYEVADERGRSYVVMEGPLKAFESRIKRVDKHNRKAFLEFEINGKVAQAGFNCLPRAHWFPKEDTSIATLDSGLEIDLTELKKKMMA